MGERETPRERRPGAARRRSRHCCAPSPSWHAPIPELVEATPSEAIIRTCLYERPALPRLSVGRTALVGDAAHPMLPNLGQGACQAIEDAVCLAEELAATATWSRGSRDTARDAPPTPPPSSTRRVRCRRSRTSATRSRPGCETRCCAPARRRSRYGGSTPSWATCSARGSLAVLRAGELGGGRDGDLGDREGHVAALAAKPRRPSASGGDAHASTISPADASRHRRRARRADHLDALDTETGEVLRGRMRGDRGGGRRVGARFAGEQVEVAVEACTGWLFVYEALAAAGAVVHLAEPAETSALRGRSAMPRPIARTRAGCGRCWPRAACRRRGSRPRTCASGAPRPGCARR